jgi:uncharacterized membrane protein YfcA
MQTRTENPTTTGAASAQRISARSEGPRRSAAVIFTRHYLEMVVAMLLGMVVLGAALAVPLELAGADVSNWDAEAPALHLLGMAFTMTVPMVAWMRHHGHDWAPCREMAAAMFVPTFAGIGLLWSDVMTDVHGLLMIQHIAMFPLMLAVMLLRRDEYTRH